MLSLKVSSLICCLGAATVAVGNVAAADLAYRGLCEASAAAMLDDTRFGVGADERNVLSIYEVNRPVRAGTLDLVAYLDTEIGRDGSPKKSDLEAAARVGNR